MYVSTVHTLCEPFRRECVSGTDKMALKLLINTLILIRTVHVVYAINGAYEKTSVCQPRTYATMYRFDIVENKHYYSHELMWS